MARIANAASTPLDSECFSSIHQLFEYQSRLYGYRTAVHYRDQRLDYTALNQYANRLAHALLQLNLDSGTPVGILLERSHHCVAGILGILKANLSVVMYEEEFSVNEVMALTGQDNPDRRYVLTRRKFQNCKLISKSSERIKPLYLDHDFGRRNPNSNPGLEISTSSNACILPVHSNVSTMESAENEFNEQAIATGAEISHNALAHMIQACSESWNLDSKCRCLNHSEPSSIATFAEILLPLSVGGSVAIANGREILSAKAMTEVIVQHDVTLLQMQASQWKHWIEHIANSSSCTPTTIDKMIVAGTRVSRSHYQQWQSLTRQNTQWLQVFGTAETTIYATTFEPPAKWHDRNLPLGRALPGYEIAILDESATAVRRGESGTLFIGGNALASRYAGATESFSSAFQLYTDKAGSEKRLFNTNLQARQLLSGDIEYVGDFQRQIEVGEYAMDSREIESIAKAHESVASCRAYLDQAEDNPVLTLEVTPTPETTGSNEVLAEQLNQWLLSRLPAPMHVQRLVINDLENDRGNIFQCNGISNNFTAENVSDNQQDSANLPKARETLNLPQYHCQRDNAMGASFSENSSCNPAGSENHNYSQIDFSFDNALSQQLSIRCFENKCSIFDMLLSGVTALLHRYSGSSDIEIHLTHPQTSGTTEPPSVRKATLTVNSREAFFNHLFNTSRKVKGALPVEPMQTEELSILFGDNKLLSLDERNKFQLQFQLDLPLQEIAPEKLSCISGHLSFKTETFSTLDMENMARHLVQIVKSATDSPRTSIALLQLLPDTEKHSLLYGFNQTDALLDLNCSIAELIEHQSARLPDKNAVLFGDTSISYASLIQKVNILAGFLCKQNAGPNTLVAVYLQRGIDLIIALLAIQRSGAAHLPLDPNYPIERIDHILADSGVQLMITQDSLAQSFRQFDLQKILIDRDWNNIAALQLTPPPAKAQPDNLCYTIYTSGSTGLPKGVKVSQRNVLNFLRSMQKKPGIKYTDTLLAVTTIAFDISVLEIFLPLISGATLDLIPRDIAIDGSLLAERISFSNCTLLQATPATWRLLLESGWQGSASLTALIGGEALPADLVPALLPKVNSLWNMYGPTETTVWSTCKKIEQADADITIGRPIDNTQVLILDRNGRLCPINIPGELCIAGHGVAMGYANRRGLTQEKFVAHPFDTRAGQPISQNSIYRTGDVAKWNHQGELVCLGRQDNQIKLRGHRVEPGEIEAQLARAPGIEHGVVQLIKADSGTGENTPCGTDRLVAYVITNTKDCEEDSNLQARLRSHLGESLPDYMIPSQVIVLQSMPRTDNGKIDRAALPRPQQVANETGSNPQQSKVFRTFTEKQVALMWQELLGTELINRNDNFFVIGGHSLIAMRFISKARKQFNSNISARSLMTSNLAQIARQLAPRNTELPATTDSTTREATNASNDRSEETDATNLTDGESTSSVENFYFKSGSQSLYGICHSPVDQASRGAILICQPIGHEYMRLHRSLGLLADSLASSGYFVLRFDYSGTGNSSSNLEDVEPGQWQTDILAATAKLQENSGYSSISMIACRVASLLLPNSDQLQTRQIDRLVLWDPVYSGSTLLDSHRQLMKSALASLDRYRWRQKQPDDCELIGHKYNARLCAAMENYQLDPRTITVCKTLLVLSQTGHTGTSQKSSTRASKTKAGYIASAQEPVSVSATLPEQRVVDDNYLWTDSAQTDSMILAFHAIRAINEWFS